MSIAQVRGGIPHILRESIDTTGRYHQFTATSFWLKVRVETFPLKMYFTEDDWTNDVNYILVQPASATYPYGQWEGPIEARGIWLKGSGGTSAMELVAFNRRG